MAQFMSKVNMPIAAQSSHLFNLSMQHLTTSNFMQFNPILCREIVGMRGKGQKPTHISVNVKSAIKALPMMRPYMGQAQVSTRAFFVPMRVIWEPYTDFLGDVPHAVDSGSGLYSQIAQVPRITNADLVGVLSASPFAVSGSAADHDISYGTTQSTSYYKFTSAGRLAMKHLEALGYKVIWSLNNDARSIQFSALPLLAMCKIFMDYYFPNMYCHYGVFATLDLILRRQDTYVLTSTELSDILSFVSYVFYEPDYFTSAWDSPVAPNSGTTSLGFKLPDMTMPPSSTNATQVEQYAPSGGSVYQGTPFMRKSGSSSPAYVTEYNIESLKALTDYVRRHQLVGSRALERLLSRYGVTLDNTQLRRSLYLSADTYPIKFGEVTATSDTFNANADTGAVLGDFAGAGFAGNREGKTFEFDAEEFGYFIVVNSITPQVGYVQGYNKQVMHLSKLDFFTPEFDGLGTAPLHVGELIVADDYPTFNDTIKDAIFGFTGTYAEYKVANDMQTGDFRWQSVNKGLVGMSMMREIKPSTYGAADACHHSLDFIKGSMDAAQYSLRNFYVESKDLTDVFVCMHNFDIALRMAALPLFDTYEFDHEDESRRVDVQSGGALLN